MGHGLNVSPEGVHETGVWPEDSLDPHRGRGGGAGRANSKKDLVTDRILSFCALQATPADRFRLAPISKDQASIPIDEAEDHRGQWVLRRVGSNGMVSVDNQLFPVINAFKGTLIDVFVDATVIQGWSKNHLIKTVARERSGPVRADGLNVKRQPTTNRQASQAELDSAHRDWQPEAILHAAPSSPDPSSGRSSIARA